MNPDPASLDNLRDIVEPLSVSWWPPATGWWFVSVTALTVAGWLLFRLIRNWHANAYRRAALRAVHSAKNNGEIAAILKRTALAVYPRTDIAELTGGDWIAWLEQSGGQKVPRPVADTLVRGIFREGTRGDTAEMARFASQWIRDHRPPADKEDRAVAYS